MGLSGISPGSLLLILLILVFVMGGSRLRTLGEDLGAAYKGFKKAFNEDNDKANQDKIND
jgi:sec-independent protein translocase protein TatA